MSQLEDQYAASRHLCRLLILVAERTKADFAQAVGPSGLPIALARALLILTEPTPMRELAWRLACDPSNITGITDQLEQRGLVARVPGKDRRVKFVELTPAGLELRNQIADSVARTVAAGRRLDSSQRALLTELLENLVEP
jgi:DNA-binding MarR family transcriptional regulator